MMDYEQSTEKINRSGNWTFAIRKRKAGEIKRI
jgi:hypothetical protein